MAEGELLQLGFAKRREVNQHLPAIRWSPRTGYQAAARQPVDQLDGAVVLDLQSFGNHSNTRRLTRRSQTSEGQQQLVLLRFQACGSRRLLAEMEKSSNLVAKFRERLIVWIFNAL